MFCFRQVNCGILFCFCTSAVLKIVFHKTVVNLNLYKTTNFVLELSLTYNTRSARGPVVVLRGSLSHLRR
jgi:hypothetical protein